MSDLGLESELLQGFFSYKQKEFLTRTPLGVGVWLEDLLGFP